MKNGIKLTFIFIITLTLIGIYFLSRQAVTKPLKVGSQATEISQGPTPSENEFAPDESPSDLIIPTQTATAIPQPTLAKTDNSQISPDQCQAEGGTCLYDLNCSDFGMTASGACYGLRPNGMAVDCCKKPIR